MKPYFRPAVPSDAPGCVTVLRDWVDETPWMRESATRSAMEAFWRRGLETEFAWVAACRREIRGFCLRNVGDENNIGALYVARAARGRGVGKGLLDRAKAGCDHITVWAFERNVEARRFYAREGLIELSRERDDFTGLIDVEHRWERPRSAPGPHEGVSSPNGDGTSR